MSHPSSLLKFNKLRTPVLKLHYMRLFNLFCRLWSHSEWIVTSATAYSSQSPHTSVYTGTISCCRPVLLCSGCSVSCCTPLNGIAKLGEANDGQNVLTLRQKDENNSFVRPVYERNITLRSKCPLDLQSVTFEFRGVCNVKLTLLSENGTLDPVDVLTKDYRSENGTLKVRHNFSIHTQQTWKNLLKSSKPGVIIIRITLSQINGCWIAPVLNKAKRGWSITGRGNCKIMYCSCIY